MLSNRSLIPPFWFVLVVLLAASGVQAQVPPAAHQSSTASLTLGYFNVDFRYADGGTGQVYAFKGPATAFMLSSDVGSLSFAYGSGDISLAIPGLSVPGSDSTHTTDTRMFDVALISGGNVNLVEDIAGIPLPLRVFAPIRVHLGYRNVAFTDDKNFGDIPASVHLANAGLGVGIGAQARIPTSVPVLDDRLIGSGSLVVAYGAMADMGQFIDQRSGFYNNVLHFARTTDFNLEAKLERLLNNKTGVTIGYTYRTTYWSDKYLSGIDDAVQGLQSLEGFSQRNRQHLFRIGINW